MTQQADYSDSYDPDLDFDRHYTLATARAIAPQIHPGQSVLELGCATGLMTEAILAASQPGRWLGVDRSSTYLERARSRSIAAEMAAELAAEFVTGDLDSLGSLDTQDTLDAVEADQIGVGWDHILLTNVLHEVADPARLLRWVRGVAAPGARIHVTLQNPDSVHRLCAVELGMIEDVKAISDRGSQWGTRGLWSSDDLGALAAEVGLEVLLREGIMLKPLPNNLMATLSDDVIEGFIRVARHFPEHSAMNYLVFG